MRSVSSAPDIPFVRQRYPGNNPQQCRLAGAVATEETHALARLDLKINMGEQRHMAISKRDIVEAK